jgi:hypothetical protein
MYNKDCCVVAAYENGDNERRKGKREENEICSVVTCLEGE